MVSKVCFVEMLLCFWCAINQQFAILLNAHSWGYYAVLKHTKKSAELAVNNLWCYLEGPPVIFFWISQHVTHIVWRGSTSIVSQDFLTSCAVSISVSCCSYGIMYTNGWLCIYITVLYIGLLTFIAIGTYAMVQRSIDWCYHNMFKEGGGQFW